MSGPAPDGTRCSRVTARPDEVEGRRHPASESNRRLIGAGKGARLPLPPNRACASPAHGSPVSGFSSRLARQPSGFDQGEKPFGSEKCIGPATVVGITPPRKFLSLGRATVLLASSLEPQFFTAKAQRSRSKSDRRECRARDPDGLERQRAPAHAAHARRQSGADHC